MFSIKKGFKNYREIYYDNIRDIHYDQKSDMNGNLGTPIAETTYQDNPFITSSFKQNNGVYIYQSKYDKNKALRIYRDYADYKFIVHNDEKLVSELQKRQKYVKLTDFPTGVASIENYTVGQEIPYYENYITIANAMISGQINDPILIQLKMLDILIELDGNKIAYSDIHTENFMINIKNMTMKLIDFEPFCVHFDENAKRKYIMMIDRLKRTITRMNKFYGINLKDDFNKSENLNQIEECIREKQYILLKK